jgi:hypothetical protein
MSMTIRITTAFLLSAAQSHAANLEVSMKNEERGRFFLVELEERARRR